jgi:prepilin-type N-terminal cleavage/methylation domain-containing protein
VIHNQRRSRGQTLIEILVVAALIAIAATATYFSMYHGPSRSTDGAIAALDAAMESAESTARANATGATLEITPDPMNPGLFMATIFAGTPQQVGDTLTQVRSVAIPSGLNGAKGSTIASKWTTQDTTGTVDVLISNDGDTDFAENWDPSTPATTTYGGCTTNQKLGFTIVDNAVAPTGTTSTAYATMTLPCGETQFTETLANGSPAPLYTPPPLPTASS